MADVICPQCGGRYHETTEEYVADVVTTGNMLSLKKTYRDNGWSTFPQDAGTSLGDMWCPECGGSYSDNGVVRIDKEQYTDEMIRQESTASVYAMAGVEQPGTEVPPEVPPGACQEKRRPGRPRKDAA